MASQELGHLKGALFGGFDRHSVIDFLEVLGKERNGYRNELEESQLRCEELETALQAATQEKKQLEEQMAVWEKEREKLNAVAKANQTRAQTLEKDLRMTSEKLDEARKETAHLSAVEESLQTSQVELAQLRAQVLALQAEKEKALRRVARVMDSCSDMIRDLKREYRDLREDAAVTVEHLRRHLTRLDARLGEADALLDEPETRIQELEAMVERGRDMAQAVLTDE